MRDLDDKIDEWRSQMAAGGVKSPAVLDELESHLCEDIEREMRVGSDEAAAFETAVKRIGRSEVLKVEFAKIEHRTEMSPGKLMGIACCFASALYSVLLAPPLISIPELGSLQRLSGLAAVSLTLLSLASLRFGYKYLPVIRNRRTRVMTVTTCGLAAVVWLFIFSNLLPDVIVPRLLGRTASTTHVARVEGSGGYATARNSLLVHNRVSIEGDQRIIQPGFVSSSTRMTAIFNIGLSLFWAMTFAAALGGIAYGLEEAARRGTKENAYV